MKTTHDILTDIGSWYIRQPIIIATYGLDANKSFAEQFSPASLEYILFYAVAFAVWSLMQLFDLHKQEVKELIADMKPHTERWYANVARRFQYGFNLLPDSDRFDNGDKSDDEIVASRIVAYSAVQEVERVLIVKVAKEAGDLSPIAGDELKSFTEYMQRVKDAGVQLEILSTDADSLKLDLEVYYNPLILNSNGRRLDDGSQPIQAAIHDHLRKLPFNGEFVLAHFVDALQGVEGIVIPHLKGAWYKYGNLGYTAIAVSYIPYAGYLRIEEADLTITYVPKTEISA